MKRYEAEPTSRLLLNKEGSDVLAKIGVFSDGTVRLATFGGLSQSKEEIEFIRDWLNWIHEDVIPPPDSEENRSL